MPETAGPKALIVDDEPDICELLSMTLDRMDIETEIAHDVAGAKRLLENGRFQLCLTDMRLPDGNGLKLIEWMQRERPRVPVAMITAHGNVETAVKALKLGAFDFITKPLDVTDLRNIVAAAMRLTETAEPDDGGLIGESPAIERVRELIARVARSQAPVHICGESGTGKELVARMIHDASPRGEGPFVPVNCGAIPSELMESEFFGHRKGSFTGAVADKVGLVESADGGTLFLDEIADLPLPMQVKLLRVIQEKSVRPVGASRERAVDVRILSATHQHLGELVKKGEFREDLYYRVNVIELAVPPLRERGDDVLLLAEAILKRLSRHMEVPCPRLGPDAEAALRAYPFPGNVRELENVLERAMTLQVGEVIGAGDLQLQRDETAVAAAEASGSGPLDNQLEDLERKAIMEALEKTRFNKTAAARLLGMSFRQLRYRIKKYGIN